MLVVIKKKIIFVNIYVLIFVLLDMAESKWENNTGHVIITHMGKIPYVPVINDELFPPRGYFEAEVFNVPVNDTDDLKGDHTRKDIIQNVIKFGPSSHSASFSVGGSFKVGKSGENAARFTRRADYKTFKARRLAKEEGDIQRGEQISTGPIRITAGPNEGVKVDGYLKNEVITGLNRPTKLKVEDPPPGWKPLIKPNGFNFETKAKLKLSQDLREQDSRKRVGPTPGVMNQISGNLDSMRYYPLRRNPYYKVYGYPSIVELPPERSYYIQRDPMRSYGPGFYSNYYPDRLNQNYYFNGFNHTGLVPTERFRNRFDMGTSGFRSPHSGFNSAGPSPRFGYASLYPTDFENDDFYSRIQSPGFDSKLDFPGVKWDFKSDLEGRNIPNSLPQAFPPAPGNLGLNLGPGGGAGAGVGVNGGRGRGNAEVARSFETELKNSNQDKNQINVQRTVDTQENFGTKTEFYK